MRRAVIRLAFIFCTGSMLLLSRHVSADEPGIYEPTSKIEIGPVFLTQAQRWELDRQRLLPQKDSHSSAEDSDEAKPKEKTREAAGYIISSAGSRKEWSGSDFVAVPGAKQALPKFPGEIAVQRHAADGDRDAGK